MGMLRNIIVHSDNPFFEDLFVPKKNKSVQITTNKKLGIFDADTGEVLSEGNQIIKTFKTVDSDKFVKIFTDRLGSLFGLTSAGQKVFSYLLYAVQSNSLGKDRVLLSKHSQQDFFKEQNVSFSTTTYLRGLRDLIENRILAQTETEDVFYINPAIIFNGNRLTFVEEYFRSEGKNNSDKIKPFPQKKRANSPTNEPPLIEE